MKQVVIEMSVDSTKQMRIGGTESETQHSIECNIPYGQNDDNIFHRMSGGSTLNLFTINQEAAKIFKAGGKIKVTIEAID